MWGWGWRWSRSGRARRWRARYRGATLGAPRDPLTLAAVVGVVAAAGLCACYIPARRAARVDRLVAPQHEQAPKSDILGSMAPDPLGTLDAVLAGLHTLAGIAEEVGDEALQHRITGAVTGLRAAILTVRGEILQQHERIEELEAQARQAEAAIPRRERPHRMKFGCYQFDDTEGLFCPACYDRQGRRVRTIPRAGTTLVCPNCRSAYPMR